MLYEVYKKGFNYIKDIIELNFYVILIINIFILHMIILVRFDKRREKCIIYRKKGGGISWKK